MTIYKSPSSQNVPTKLGFFIQFGSFFDKMFLKESCARSLRKCALKGINPAEGGAIVVAQFIGLFGSSINRATTFKGLFQSSYAFI